VGGISVSQPQPSELRLANSYRDNEAEIFSKYRLWEKTKEYDNKRVVPMTSCSLGELVGKLLIATQMQGSMKRVWRSDLAYLKVTMEWIPVGSWWSWCVPRPATYEGVLRYEKRSKRSEKVHVRRLWEMLISEWIKIVSPNNTKKTRQPLVLRSLGRHFIPTFLDLQLALCSCKPGLTSTPSWTRKLLLNP